MLPIVASPKCAARPTSFPIYLYTSKEEEEEVPIEEGDASDDDEEGEEEVRLVWSGAWSL